MADAKPERLRAYWQPCPTCGREWPHARGPSPSPDVEIDWTCVPCLHAEVAALKRRVAALNSVVKAVHTAGGDY